MLNVRINEEIEEKLNKYSLEEGLSKSSIVKEALAQYFTSKEKSTQPYVLGLDLFGLEGSGDDNASTTYKQKLKEKLHEKHSH